MAYVESPTHGSHIQAIPLVSCVVNMDALDWAWMSNSPPQEL